MAMLGASLEDLKAVYDPLIAQEKALATARQDLALLTLELEQGPEAALAERRRLELEAMDESLRPMQERIWALQDEAEAAAKLAEALTRAKDLMDDASIRIVDLQDPAGAQQRARERELADALKGQTGATADELRRLYESLWQLEDAATAAAAAAEALRAVQDETKKVQDALDDARDPGGAKERARRRQLNDALVGIPAGSTGANRPPGYDALIALYEELWRLQDAAEAAATAAARLAEAQELKTSAEIKIQDLLDPEGAKDRARQREIMAAVNGQTSETAEELRRLYADRWQIEDATSTKSDGVFSAVVVWSLHVPIANSYLEMLPDVVAARYIAAGEPSPPAPTHTTRAPFRRRWPSMPTSGRMTCRA
jgi:hypothetical protein